MFSFRRSVWFRLPEPIAAPIYETLLTSKIYQNALTETNAFL